ncbi:glycosyltransferase [Dactylosporangium sp. NPDC049140]|uniref:glycosyltransferase n=1 Tax=Dactylosporangium sp. NPDC049140 TaxID=3155647 RepID=UPI0034083773
MVRVAIMAVGRWGDLAPYAGLGVRLQQAGHRVTVAADGRFEGYLRGHGLGFHRLPLEALAATLFPGRPAPDWDQLAAAMLDAARAADLLLLTSLTSFGVHIAEGLGRPGLGVYRRPVTPSSAVRGRPYRAAVDRLRAGLGLPPVTARAFQARRRPICFGYSPIVVPPPEDWPPWYRAVGFWWPPGDPGFTPDPALLDFLAAGPPPVYVGLGDRSDLVVKAVRKAKVRALVHEGAGGDDVLAIGDVPHEWLFPQTAAVVHHGGAGTTAAGLRAGVPAVPVPFRADQPFWAQRLTALGVTPGPVPRRRLTVDRLAAVLSAAVGDPVYRHRAEALAARLAPEDGAARVLRAIDLYV